MAGSTTSSSGVLEARGGLRAIGRADERDDLAVRLLQQPDEDGGADEAGDAGQEDGVGT